MRCRTCCKSRGFDCVTHVKSTWVPASVRRERHQNLIIQDQHQPQQHQPQQEQEHYYMGVVNPKRRRDNNSSSSSLVCTQLPITTSTTSVTNTNTASFSGMELRNFPAEVSSEAVFRCVRVSSVDETDEEYAYQTAVNIGGHVFKGILYDHGPDHPHQSSAPSPSYVAGETGGNLAVRPTASIGGPTAAASIMPTSSSSPAVGYLDPSFYPLTYMSPGTPFFSNPNQRP
ncbi:hypothetical protein BVRB_6g129660 [Beta vulgaris subsp. vulgaris]|nr:hypothetical protein BVRB_6g129660 [Beta vulgaris subsp. vulgaris]